MLMFELWCIYNLTQWDNFELTWAFYWPPVIFVTGCVEYGVFLAIPCYGLESILCIEPQKAWDNLCLPSSCLRLGLIRLPWSLCSASQFSYLIHGNQTPLFFSFPNIVMLALAFYVIDYTRLVLFLYFILGVAQYHSTCSRNFIQFFNVRWSVKILSKLQIISSH